MRTELVEDALKAAAATRGSLKGADNALAESFNATLKREVLQDAACWTDELTCRRQVFKWLARYNTEPHHSWCRYAPPVAHEIDHTATLPAAA